MSFFGFDSSLPPEKAEQEYGDEMNDQTFGMDVSSIQGSEFTFSPQKPSNGTSRVLTVEELEAQLQKPKKILTLEEIERQLTDTSIQGHVVASEPEPAPVQNTSSVYDGLMLPHEKEFVAKVQLSQLASDASFLQDYYNRRFIAKRTGRKIPDISTLLSGSDAHSGSNETEQEKFARILSEVKSVSRPKADKLAFEGALGKIAVNSLRNPKKLLEMKPRSITPETHENKSLGFSLKRILLSAEKVLSCLILVDDLYQEYQDVKESAEPSTMQQNDWNRKYTEVVKKIWAELHNVSKNVKIAPSSELLKSPPSEKSMILYLSVSKGRKSMPRILKFLPPEQLNLLLKVTLASLKNIMITSAEPVSVLAELDEYSNFVVYPFVPALSECPISLILDCVGALLTAGEVIAIARTKVFPNVGFLIRAELLRQQHASGKQGSSNDEILRWTQTTFPALFATFQTRFAALFPPAYIMPPIVTSSSSTISQPIPVDDQYVWQFLASLAIGASLDQQRVLVAELRDKIFEVVTSQGESGTKRANLLLNALGLDASQLAV